MKAFILFLLGLATFVFALLRKVAGQTAALDAAEAAKKAADAEAEAAKARLADAEVNAKLVNESVSQRLNRLYEEDEAQREKSSVDVANDIIGRN
jgi:hypothetical protein